MTTPFVGDMDFTQLVFAPMTNDGRQRVDVYTNPNMSKRDRIRVNLCPDVAEPLAARWPLDTVREDSNPDRRGQGVLLDNERALRSLKTLDETIVRAAVANSTKWFKKDLSEEQVRARYKTVVGKLHVDDEKEGMKFKVKCGNADVPTVLHRREADGVVRKRGGRVEDLEGWNAKLVPIVSAYGLWFMGGGSQFGIAFQAEDMIVTPGEVQDSLSQFASKEPLVVEDDAPTTKQPKVELTEETAM